MLNPQRLRVFREVASRGSFSAAADSLSYTQSAVSQSVAALEAEMGVTLLERDRRGARPTSAGEALVAHADAILAQLDAAEAEVAAIAGLRGGQLAMASFPTAGATIMPLAVATFRAAHPEVTLSLAEGEPEEIAPRLRAGEFDLALLFEFVGVSEGLGPGLRRIEHRLHQRLIKAAVHYQRHHGYAIRRRNLQHVGRHVAADEPLRVHRERLRGDDRDLRGMRFETGDRPRTPHQVHERRDFRFRRRSS